MLETYVPDVDTVFQFVAGSQPINALAFVLDGLYYGVSDFGYASYSMVFPDPIMKGNRLCHILFSHLSFSFHE